MTTPANTACIGFIGFGEAAMAFVSGWGGQAGARLSAYDIKPGLADRFAAHGTTGHATPHAALRDVQAVFCVVTADQALVAAQSAADGLASGTHWFDCNSCAPDTKRAAARVIEAAGGRYVDVAVMAPVHPRKHHVPLLVSGPHAAAGAEALAALDMRPTVIGEGVGQASTIKMLRSVMVKGLEALSAECFLAARRAGVEDKVLASLTASDPQITWATRTSYNLERMMVHGARRAAEMREVAKTVTDLGLPGAMSSATAQWQDYIAALDAAPGEDDFIARLDAVLSGAGRS